MKQTKVTWLGIGFVVLFGLGITWASEYYTHGNFPSPSSPATSSSMRAELDLISAGFSKLPTLTANANKVVVVNSGATGLTTTTGQLALGGNLTITGAFNTTLTQSASTTLTLPGVSGTLATLSGTETLTNKTILNPSITAPSGLTSADVGLGNVNNTSDATKNAASVTLTNKTILNPSITAPSGLISADVGLGNVDNTSDATKNAASVTLTNKTLTAPTISTQVSGTAIASQAEVDAGTSAVKIVVPSLNQVSMGTPTASTSGTSIDYTSLPASVRVIKIMFSGVSTNGTSTLMIQLGDSGGIENSGYLGGACFGDGTASCANHNTGFVVGGSGAGAAIKHGTILLTLLDSSTNTWSFSSTISNSDTSSNAVAVASGAKSTSAVLDRIRITTVNGTDTFDAGKVNIQYER